MPLRSNELQPTSVGMPDFLIPAARSNQSKYAEIPSPTSRSGLSASSPTST